MSSVIGASGAGSLRSLVLAVDVRERSWEDPGMSYEFRMPDIGEGVTEGEIVEWHVRLGEQVAEDQPMVEVLTDKATVTIGAPRSGRIEAIRFKAGDTVRVGEIIVSIGTAEEHRGSNAPASVAGAATAVGDIRDVVPGAAYFAEASAAATASGVGSAHGARSAPAAGGSPASHDERPGSSHGAPGNGRRSGNGGAPKGAAHPGPAPVLTDYFCAKPLATPAARKLARELGVDLKRVKPTGQGERVTMEDIRNHSVASRLGESSQQILPAQREFIAATSRTDRASLERRVPFVGVRRKIAQRMQAATTRAAHFTFVEECHVDRLVELRDRMRGSAAKQGVRLNFLPFIVKSVCMALKRHPMLNSFLDEEAGELVYREYYDLGIATATDAGLLVPVLHDADHKSLLELAREIERLAEGARDGTLRADELSGSTFTVTSLGRRGGVFATPILNYPEVGILGVHRIREKPIVRDGKVEVGSVMMLSLTFDHRVVDGDVGTAFAYEVVDLLENPERIFLELA